MYIDNNDTPILRLVNGLLGIETWCYIWKLAGYLSWDWYCRFDGGGCTLNTELEALVDLHIVKAVSNFCFIHTDIPLIGTFNVKFNLKVHIYPFSSLSVPYLITHSS